MSGPPIGALCAGFGGLDLAVQDVLGGHLAWVAENDPAASKVLAHRFPGVPNLGDITRIDWPTVPPVDIVTAGFPCTDVSLAGRREGLTPGTRSGLWTHIAAGLAVLRPSLVVIENVRGLLSAKADRGDAPDPDLDPLLRHLLETADEATTDPRRGDLGPDDEDLGDVDGSRPVLLRALGAVLGDLAECGFDAEWTSLRAADVGACHGRFRVGVLAWPAADAHSSAVRLEPVTLAGRGGAAFPGLLGDERDAAADPVRGRLNGGARDAGRGAIRRTAAGWLGEGIERRVAADAGRDARAEADPHGTAAGRGGRATADPDGVGPVRGGPARRWGTGPEDDRREPAPDAHLAWGPYEAAIRRWEMTLGRPAPAPTEPGTKGQPRLSPRFVEWMQGCPEGWVTDVPGLSRNDMLRILGNGVVRQQFSAVIRILLARTGWEVAA